MSFRICGKVIDVGHCLYNIAPMRKLIPFVNHPLKMEDEQQAEEKNKRKGRRCKKRPDGSSSRFPDQPDDRQADQEKRKAEHKKNARFQNAEDSEQKQDQDD